MSVYIKGMEMPKTYPLTVTIYPDGQVLPETVGAKDKHGIAVPIPLHGRLGDLDVLYDVVKKRTRNWAGGWSDIECVLTGHDIKNAPTIIPAEPSEEQRKYEAQVEAAQYCEMYESSYDPDTGAL